MDYGTFETELAMMRLQKRITEVYSEAQKDIEWKINDFNSKYKVKESIYSKQLSRGEITEEDFEAWKRGQVFQGKQWEAKREQIVHTLTNANEISTRIINGETRNVFMTNANFMAYSLEHTAGVDFGFGVYDSDTVARLLRDNPKMLPEWKINEPKDYIWNEKKVNTQITQGIIQGESLDKISKRLAKNLSTQNANLMRTFARTAMTGAQNAGRLQSMDDAEKLGIKLEKEWMATLDSRTRDSHASMDGESVPVDKKFSNGCMFPGDPSGPPHEVYNCRCTMVADVKDYPSVYSRRDNETGQVVNKLGPDTVENLTYRDWKMTKGITQTAKLIDEKDQVSSIIRDIASMGHGSVDSGLPFKYKSFDSAFRKIVGDTKEEIRNRGLSPSRNRVFTMRTQFADKTSDALRFTNVSPSEYFVQDYNMFVDELHKRGFETIRVKNTLGMRDVPYRGVNTLVRTPSGYVIEMQYHTPQSINIKENVNHKIYEEVRKLDPNDPKIDILNKRMMDNMNSIDSPPGIDSIGWIKYDTNNIKNITPFGDYW